MKQEYILKTIGGQQRPDPFRKELVSAGECLADSFKQPSITTITLKQTDAEKMFVGSERAGGHNKVKTSPIKNRVKGLVVKSFSKTPVNRNDSIRNAVKISTQPIVKAASVSNIKQYKVPLVKKQ